MQKMLASYTLGFIYFYFVKFIWGLINQSSTIELQSNSIHNIWTIFFLVVPMYAITPYALIWTLEKTKIFNSPIKVFANKYPLVKEPTSMFVFIISYFLSTTALALSFMGYFNFDKMIITITIIFYIMLILSEITVLYYNKKWLNNSLYIFMLSSIVIYVANYYFY